MTDKTGDKELAQRIRELRAKKNITQKQLAEGTSLSVQTIRSIETGERFVSKDSAERLAIALGVTVKFILSGIEEPKPVTVKPKSRIPDMPPDDPPLSQEKLDLLNDPRIGLMFSMNTLGQLSNRQLNQIVSQIEFFIEENEELKKLIRGNKQDGTSS